MKVLDIPVTTYEMTDDGIVTLLNIIPQGTSNSERIGKNIALLGFQMRGKVEHSTGSGAQSMQYALVYDSMPNGTLPTASDIFTSTDSYGFPDDYNTTRYTVFRDQRFDMRNANGSSMIHSIRDNINLNKYTTQYGSLGTGSIADVYGGALYLVCMSDQPLISTHPSMTVSIRLRYFDL